MENALEALKMAFGMMAFVLAMSVAMYLFTMASSTAQVLLYSADKTNYYDNLQLTDTDVTARKVNVETIIPTLYRYYKENFAVKIYNKNGDLTQIFDLNIEGKIRKASGVSSSRLSNDQRALISLYGVSTTPLDSKNPYLFEAPWLGGNGDTNKDIKTRIDLYVSGKCGYINGTKVDYTNNNLKKFGSNNFLEQFSEFAYKGDTISTDDGTETITGNTKVENKIVITYTEIDE